MKDSGTQIHCCSSFTKTSNLIELHRRTNHVVVELASMEKIQFNLAGTKRFYKTLPKF